MKRELLSSQNFQSSSLHKFSKEIFCTLALALSLFLSSCNNLGSLASRSPTSELTLADPNSGIGGSFQLSGVYPSQQSPGSMFDMVGIASQFDSYCTGTTTGPCVCEYTYNSPGNGPTTEEGTVQYQESNLLRCDNKVPTEVGSFDVKILAKGSGDYSNVITVNLAAGAFVNTNFVDLSKEEAYQQVKRFQCRKREAIMNPLSKAMIDPIQSEDPKIIYPFNFYSTNVASSLWEMQQLGNQDWDCTLTPTYDRALHWWANANVYSASPCTEAFCAGDNELIYPQDSLVSGKVPVNNLAVNGKRRGSFYLSKQSYGVFQVAVKAAVAPNNYVSSTYGTIGYAARPIPNNGSSSCPSITLPLNAIWVKLWNYRATDITPPKKVIKYDSAENSAITCNVKAGPTLSCDKPSSTPGVTTNWSSVTLGAIATSPNEINFSNPSATLPATTQLTPVASIFNTLSSRVANYTSNNNQGQGTMSPDACYNIAAMGNGQEAWDPSPFAFNDLSVAALKGLVWHIYDQAVNTAACGSTFKWFTDAGGSCSLITSGVKLLEDEPSDTLITSDVLNPSNYTDQIFVVTKPDVDDSMMRNQALAISHFKPVTYRTSGDCNGATRTGCPVSKQINWEINIKNVGSPTGADQYPLCVLQFTD